MVVVEVDQVLDGFHDLLKQQAVQEQQVHKQGFKQMKKWIAELRDSPPDPTQELKLQLKQLVQAEGEAHQQEIKEIMAHLERKRLEQRTLTEKLSEARQQYRAQHNQIQQLQQQLGQQHLEELD